MSDQGVYFVHFIDYCVCCLFVQFYVKVCICIYDVSIIILYSCIILTPKPSTGRLNPRLNPPLSLSLSLSLTPKPSTGRRAARAGRGGVPPAAAQGD